jgi:hypothetical protein
MVQAQLVEMVEQVLILIHLGQLSLVLASAVTTQVVAAELLKVQEQVAQVEQAAVVTLEHQVQTTMVLLELLTQVAVVAERITKQIMLTAATAVLVS